MKIKELRKLKILIVGMGREGATALDFLHRAGCRNVATADQANIKNLSEKAQKIIAKTGVKFYSGNNYLAKISQFDLVIKSPGIKKELFKNAKKITTATQIFFDNCPGKIIGITGSKGKSTTSNAIYQILKEAKKRTKFCGNIGKPMLENLSAKITQEAKKTIYIVELSSFQLEDLTISPHIAVFTSLFPDHIDYHGSFDKYKKAKMNIFKYQTKNDFAIVPNLMDSSIRSNAETSSSQLSEEVSIKTSNNSCRIDSSNDLINNSCRIDSSIRSNLGKAKTITFGSADSDSKIHNNYFVFNNEKIAPTDFIKLPGEHNKSNISAAIATAKILKIPNKHIQNALKKIHSLPHRIQFVTKKNDVEFWNDSIATNPDSAIAGIECFKNKIGCLFLGGSDRGLDFTNLAKKILEFKIPLLIFFPTTGKRIWQTIETIKPTNYKPQTYFAKDMLNAVNFAIKNTEKNKIALLSTACPSFSLWKNYEQRGKDFEKCVRDL